MRELVISMIILTVVVAGGQGEKHYTPPAPRPRQSATRYSTEPPSTLPPPKSSYEQVLTTLQNAIEAANASNRLALELFRATNSRGNIFIAPFSISTVLSMIYQGASGKTADELVRVMGYGNHTKNLKLFLSDGFKSIRELIQEEKGFQNELVDVNAVLINAKTQLLRDVERRLKYYYGATVEQVNFERAESIKILDTLIELQTRGRIKNAFAGKELSPNTVMVLANVIYFKGVWEKRFNPKDTFKDKFLNEGLQAYAKETDFMTITDYFQYTYYPALKMSAVDLPYTGHQFALSIFLPDNPSVIGELEDKIQVDDIQKIITDMEPTQVEIQLPRFKISTSLDLKKDLYKLGLKTAFDENEAEFPYFTGDDSLHITEFVHQTIIEVNEHGTVAAASTAAAHGTRSRIVKFHVKHPFVFLIRDTRTNLVLFFGKDFMKYEVLRVVLDIVKKPFGPVDKRSLPDYFRTLSKIRTVDIRRLPELTNNKEPLATIVKTNKVYQCINYTHLNPDMIVSIVLIRNRVAYRS